MHVRKARIGTFEFGIERRALIGQGEEGLLVGIYRSGSGTSQLFVKFTPIDFERAKRLLVGTCKKFGAPLFAKDAPFTLFQVKEDTEPRRPVLHMTFKVDGNVRDPGGCLRKIANAVKDRLETVGTLEAIAERHEEAYKEAESRQ